MTRIPSDLARFGLPVELVPGWETRGSSAFAPAGVTCHWTAGPKAAKLSARPSLNVVINGRAGLPGPLCNVYLDRAGVCVVVAAGRANHAGAGGFRGLVGNSAVYGIEAECGGDGDWTKEQNKTYPRLVAALLSGLGRDASWAHGHHEWAPTRKIDIRDIMPAVRSGAAAILANPQQEDDMPLIPTDADVVLNRKVEMPGGKKQLSLADFLRSSDAVTDETRRLIREIAAGGTAGGMKPIGVDAEGVAAALAANGAFVDALAEATAQKLAARLQA